MTRKLAALAMDFDQTVMKVHTGGYIERKNLSMYQAQINPEAMDTMLMCYENGIQVFIVTFADDRSILNLWAENPKIACRDTNLLAGSEMVYQILLPEIVRRGMFMPLIVTAIPKTTKNKNLHLEYILSGLNMASSEEAEADAKEAHMREAEETRLVRGKESKKSKKQPTASSYDKIQPSQILLIDDDKTNIEGALEQGYSAIHIPACEYRTPYFVLALQTFKLTF